MHDGHMDTYTFTKDPKKITLTPLKSSFPSKPKENPKIGVFLTPLLKSQKHKFESYKELIFARPRAGPSHDLTLPSIHPSFIRLSPRLSSRNPPRPTPQEVHPTQN